MSTRTPHDDGTACAGRAGLRLPNHVLRLSFRLVAQVVLAAVFVLGGCSGDESVADDDARPVSEDASPADASPAWPTFDTPPRDDSPVQTDALDYTLEYDVDGLTEVRGHATWVNKTGSTAYIDQCGEGSNVMYGVIRWPERGYHALMRVWACGGYHFLVVEPGESVDFDFWLFNQFWSAPMVERIGLFRLALAARESVGGHWLPFEQRESNVFQVHPPE